MISNERWLIHLTFCCVSTFTQTFFSFKLFQRTRSVTLQLLCLFQRIFPFFPPVSRRWPVLFWSQSVHPPWSSHYIPTSPYPGKAVSHSNPVWLPRKIKSEPCLKKHLECYDACCQGIWNVMMFVARMSLCLFPFHLEYLSCALL